MLLSSDLYWDFRSVLPHLTCQAVFLCTENIWNTRLVEHLCILVRCCPSFFSGRLRIWQFDRTTLGKVSLATYASFWVMLDPSFTCTQSYCYELRRFRLLYLLYIRRWTVSTLTVAHLDLLFSIVVTSLARGLVPIIGETQIVTVNDRQLNFARLVNYDWQLPCCLRILSVVNTQDLWFSFCGYTYCL